MDGLAVIAPTASIIVAAIALSFQIRRNRLAVIRSHEDKQKEIAARAIKDIHRPQEICSAQFFSRDSGISLEADMKNLKKTTEDGFREQREATKSTHQRLDRLLNGHGE